VILALVAFASIVLADPQFRPPIRRPIPTPPPIKLPRPTPVPGPYRNPGVPPRRPIPPRRGGVSGRVGRQVDLGAILARIQNSTRTIPGLPAAGAPIPLPPGLPGIPNLPNLG
jgi:hypothetical protein